MADSRAADRAARRAEARLPELRERLAEAEWAAKQRLFEQYRRETKAAALRLISALQEASAANFAAADVRYRASAAIGSHISSIPLTAFLGVLLMPVCRHLGGQSRHGRPLPRRPGP